ncbi:MAG: hypothetical protein IJY12_00070 [Clostridia bacterium]|nr:hypothetical protein [Clostridia bacterium]
MMRGSFRFLTVSLALLLLVCVPGAYAIWTFATDDVEDVTAELPYYLDVYPWEGSEELPDDNQSGKNHAVLIEAILNGTYDGSGIGLNHPNSYLNNEINDRSNSFLWFGSDTLGSMDFWESSDINKYFNTRTQNVSFVLYFPDGVSDTYYLYTMDVTLANADGTPAIPIGQNVSPVYRTVLKKVDGTWQATETQEGYAKSAYYDNRITGSLLQYPSIDPESWKAGTP